MRDYEDVGLLDRAAANIEVVRGAYRDGAQHHDYSRFFADFAEDAINCDATSLPYGGDYVGIQEVPKLTAKFFAAWESVDFDVIEIAGGGDIVFVYLDMTFKPHRGDPLKHAVVELWRIAEGKVVELRPFYYDTKLICDVLAGAAIGPLQ